PSVGSAFDEEVSREAHPSGYLEDPHGFRASVAPARGGESERLQAKRTGHHCCAHPNPPGSPVLNRQLTGRLSRRDTRSRSALRFFHATASGASKRRGCGTPTA